MSANVQQLEQGWSTLDNILFVPHTQTDYDELVALLDQLIDIVGSNESHTLASLMEIIGVLIEKYEDENVPDITDL